MQIEDKNKLLTKYVVKKKPEQVNNKVIKSANVHKTREQRIKEMNNTQTVVLCLFL